MNEPTWKSALVSDDPDHARHLTGELAPLDAEAKRIGAVPFAMKYSRGIIRPWGKTGLFKSVNVDGTDYLWVAETGEYDGWDRYVGQGAQ